MPARKTVKKPGELKLAALPEPIAAVREELLAEHTAETAARITGPEFDAYCTAVYRLRDARARIAEEELIVPDAKNQPVVHPAYAVERMAADDLRKWGDKFKPRPSRGGAVTNGEKSESTAKG